MGTLRLVCHVVAMNLRSFQSSILIGSPAGVLPPPLAILLIILCGCRRNFPSLHAEETKLWDLIFMILRNGAVLLLLAFND